MPKNLQKLSTTHRLGTNVGNLNVSVSISDDLGTEVGAELFDAICALTQQHLIAEYGKAGKMDVTVTTVEGNQEIEVPVPRIQRYQPQPALINPAYATACCNFDEEAVA